MSQIPVLDIRGLSVDYGTGPGAVHAVSGVDLVLHRGEILGLAGESGSGKSTLAHAITRLLRPPALVTEGAVLFAPGAPDGARTGAGGAGADPGGLDIIGLDAPTLRTFRWEHISIVFQGAMNVLNPVLSIGTQLMDTLRAHEPGISRTAARTRAAELLAMVRVDPSRLQSYPHELSGGMRQRVMLAIAMALNSDVVVMDEPTTALDVVVQREVLDEVLALRDELGFAIIFITHDLSLLLELADSVAIMYAGRIVERSPAAQLYASPNHPYTRGLLDSFPNLRGPRRELTGIPGFPPDPRDLPPGCPFHPRCGQALARCSAELPQLIPLDAGTRQSACWLNQPAAPVAVPGASPERNAADGD
jgi:peptide/nickel transport system ATP-binding protein